MQIGVSLPERLLLTNSAVLANPADVLFSLKGDLYSGVLSVYTDVISNLLSSIPADEPEEGISKERIAV